MTTVAAWGYDGANRGSPGGVELGLVGVVGL